MEERMFSPNEIKPTFLEANERREKLWRELDDRLRAATLGETGPVAVVRDPEDGTLLLYAGNVQFAHAAAHRYPLRTVVISSQEDLTAYLRSSGQTRFGKATYWFGITDFAELLPWLRLYVRHAEGYELSPGELRRVHAMHQGYTEFLREHEYFEGEDDE